MADICSAWAYEDIRKSGYLGERQSMYLSVFSSSEIPLTAKEATNLVLSTFGAGSSVMGIGSRLSELEAMGFLRKVDRVECEKSHQTVNRWIYTGRTKPFKKEVREVCCKKCGGTGSHRETVWVPDLEIKGQGELAL